MFEFDFITFLKSKLAITNLVGQRIFPGRRPQVSAELPAIVFRRGTGGHAHRISGGAGRADCIVILLLITESYEDAVHLGSVAFNELVGFRGAIGSGTQVTAITSVNDYDNEEDPIDGSDNAAYVRVQHYMVQYREAIPAPTP